jgi:hypothetical protein
MEASRRDILAAVSGLSVAGVIGHSMDSSPLMSRAAAAVPPE